jgi:16S rRNA (uracil1498-N3)-methyltransferase
MRFAMPATPAWPPRSAPRLFIDTPLSVGLEIGLDGAHAHYLGKVMRLKAGDAVKLFDDKSGEYLAVITAIGKRDLILEIKGLLRTRETVPDLWLCCAPIKRDRMSYMIEKATELGIGRIIPVQTNRSVVDKINPEKLRATMIEASEQCERTALPRLDPIVKLSQLLATWPTDRHLFFADERLHSLDNESFQTALTRHPGPAAIMIGPEGGFTDSENDAIRAHSCTIPVSLGPRILRAETAAIAAISVWVAGNGDWQK